MNTINNSKRNYNELRPDQDDCITECVESDFKLVVGKVGSGKTIVGLTSFAEVQESGDVTRALVFTTKNIALTTWDAEAEAWAHTQHLTINIAVGDTAQRLNAINTSSDLVVINYDNLVWFFETFPQHNFDAIIFDELTKIGPQSRALKVLRYRMKPFKWRLGLTASPVSESYLKLYSMMLVLDDGQRLGTNFLKYKRQFFIATDYEQRQWRLMPGAAPRILRRLENSIYVLEDYRDKLPGTRIITCETKAPALIKKFYDRFAFDSLVDYGDVAVEAVNNGVLRQKMHQLTQGFLYAEDTVLSYHDLKISLLHDLLKTVDEPVIIVYWYDEDLHRLRELLPNAVDFKERPAREIVQAWNAKELPYLLIHPRSAGHGLNLAQGGSVMIWYALHWSNELFEQVVGRLARQGQTDVVRVYLLMVSNLLDPIIYKTVVEKQKFDKLLTEYFKGVKNES